MHLKRLFAPRGSLAFRLTSWYAGVFTVSSFLAFLLFYLLISSAARERMDQELIAEVKEFTSMSASRGLDDLKDEIMREAESDGHNKVFLRLLAPDGTQIASTNLSHWGNTGDDGPALKKLAAGEKYVLTTRKTERSRDEARIVYGAIDPSVIFQMGQSTSADKRFKADFQAIFVVTLFVVIVFAASTGWFMARRALLGVKEVTRTAMHISRGTLDRRVSGKAKDDEVGQLATAFNAMLDRIDSLMREMSEMSDNIAHDLRSPVARIRGVAEMTLTSRACSIEEYEEMAADTVEECDRLLAMINTMLELSEAEAGGGGFDMKRVDVAEMVREACELFQPVAEDKGIKLVTQVPEHVFLRGDTSKLQRMIANLLDNALKFTPPGGTVKISIKEEDRRALIAVEDSGVGISAEDLSQIFKRFYRCDRSRSEGGTGLGLSLAAAIARAHGGKISAESSPEKGSIFTIDLPRP